MYHYIPVYRKAPEAQLARLRLDLLDATSPLVHLEHIPVDLNTVFAENTLDGGGDLVVVARGESEDGGTSSGQADAEKTGMGVGGKGGKNLGQAGDLV